MQILKAALFVILTLIWFRLEVRVIVRNARLCALSVDLDGTVRVVLLGQYWRMGLALSEINIKVKS